VLPFFGYCLISLAWSDFPVVALKRWFKLLGELMVVLVVLTDPRPVAAIRRLLAAPAFLLVPLSVLFIKYYPDLGRGYDGWTGVQYYHGASYNKNGLGVMCLYCGLAYVWLLCREIDRKPRDRHALVIAGCVLAMCVWLLAKANSATASSCFGMGTVLILLTRLRVAVRRPALIHGTVIAITAVPFTVLFLGQITSTLDLLQRDSTLTDRTLLWEAILRLQTNPVLGSGYESFWLGWRLDALWDVFWWRPNQAHNGFIEIYINLGWVGIGLLALLVFASYRRCLGAVRLGMPSGSLLLTYTVIAIPYNFTEAAFKIHTLPWMFLVLAVTGSCAAAAAHSPVSRPRVEFPTRVPSGRGIAAPVCAATARSAFRRPIGSR
jgi:O-antigen ligase